MYLQQCLSQNTENLNGLNSETYPQKQSFVKEGLCRVYGGITTVLFILSL